MGTYQFIALPPNPRSYMTLDWSPQRKSDWGCVYTIPKGISALEEGVFAKDIRFRIRPRAVQFAEDNWRFNKDVFAVVQKCDEGRECLYFGRILFYDQEYPQHHLQITLDLTRCVGSRISKKHFKKVSEYILKYYKDISGLQQGMMIEADI